MSINRVLLAATLGLLAWPATAHAVPDYPPAGAVVEIEGDLVTGGVIQVRVRNCTLGEVVRTSIETLPTMDTICESPIAAFAAPDEATGRSPGISSHQLRLPDTPGVLEGTAELLETDETLHFELDVRGVDRPVVDVVATPASTSGGLPGWPFLLLAALIAVGVVVAAAKRREPETP